jgi:hypothetical protein
MNQTSIENKGDSSIMDLNAVRESARERFQGSCRVCLQIPEYTGHPFRFQLDTDSGTDWTVFPILSGHRFRF